MNLRNLIGKPVVVSTVTGMMGRDIVMGTLEEVNDHGVTVTNVEFEDEGEECSITMFRSWGNVEYIVSREDHDAYHDFAARVRKKREERAEKEKGEKDDAGSLPN